MKAKMKEKAQKKIMCKFGNNNKTVFTILLPRHREAKIVNLREEEKSQQSCTFTQTNLSVYNLQYQLFRLFYLNP